MIEKLVFGTAGLGLPYGLPDPGNSAVPLIPFPQAREVVLSAIQAGIRTFDTAPVYGRAEDRLGRIIEENGTRGKLNIWSKLDSSLLPGPDLVPKALKSLRRSLQRLQVERLALFQWHNWKSEYLSEAGFREWALRCGEHGDLGASTYGPDDALAAVESGFFRVVQIEWNLLNQGVLEKVRGSASRLGVRLALRSVLLQGVLTEKGDSLPPGLSGLASSLESCRSLAFRWGMSISRLALRSALSQAGVDFVLVGLDRQSQLEEALYAALSPPLEPRLLEEIKTLDLRGNPLTDPRNWSRN